MLRWRHAVVAVGDADQSIYGFTGANPELLQSPAARPDLREIRLRSTIAGGQDYSRLARRAR
ncbi:UvrD-helicase domain-containing protein [Rhizobium ruizarguesonis]|uniref:UvrD-helicase domain-containing protein n=1 Tax=Rhizobium ruizarguesonis TaxID=2081791 RepID=UPI001FE20DA6